MRSFKFPKMFNTNSSRIWKEDKHKQATQQNLTILLHCERGELFGDPYFGLLFRHYLFDQNTVLIEDALIDMIYNQVVLFMPQLRINRNDVSLIRNKERGKIYCNFVAVDQIDFTTNMYQLLVFQSDFE